MKHIFSIIMSLLLINCANSVKKSNNVSVNGNCVENLDFKEDYFKNIETVQNYIYRQGDPQKANQSLKFIAKYSKVSFEDMANYARAYPLGIYEKDYPIWLDWYEKNKCSNIQFKKK
ncbi:hypothetical protein QWZ06_13885 [Chryseobacterium tructae]|uniref:Lipoprotein n=1 Tax=Chryseobacterium tructae TaxID=1037380 RepID=A0ABV7XX35_9FLAO|nr:hypothetical protein [Chryseobacterium tructae]MDN3693298.1 hypothetical protein [Chryseobacterium tructae]